MIKLNNRIFGGFLVLASLILIQVVLPSRASAEYQSGRLIDDVVFLDAKSMSINDIQSFLASKGSGLANMQFNLYCDGSRERQLYLSAGARCDTPIPASEVIYYAAQIYGVSPKVILATMQKEQGVTTAPNPTVWQLTQAMGYACPTSGSCDSSSSFQYQIDSGTWALRYHFERARGNYTWWSQSSSWTCGTGKPSFYMPNLSPRQNVNFIDPYSGTHYTTIYIDNAATSALYCYTPHVYNNHTNSPHPQEPKGSSRCYQYSTHPPAGDRGRCYTGSFNFVRFYEAWFGATQVHGPYVAVASDGSENKLWLVNGAQKYHISSPDVLNAWKLNNQRTFPIDKNYLDGLAEMHPLTRLFQDGSTGMAYFVDGGKFYYIQNPDQVTLWNFNWNDVAPFGNNYAPNTFMSYAGALPYSFIPENIGSIFMVDGVQIRRFAGPASYQASGSPITVISSAYFNQNMASREGPNITSAVLTDGNTKLLMNEGAAYILTSDKIALYPAGETVNPATIRRLPKNARSISFFIQEPSTGKVYVMDAGQKRYVTSPNTLLQLINPERSISSIGSISLISEGPALNSTYLKDPSDNYYLINNNIVRRIDSGNLNEWQGYLANASSVSNAFITAVQPLGDILTNTVSLNGKTAIIKNNAAYIAGNNSLLALWGQTASSNVVSTPFVNSIHTLALSPYVRSSSSNDGRIFLRTSPNSLVHIRDFSTYANSLMSSTSIVALSPTEINTLAPSPVVFSAVKNGSKLYAFDNGSLREVPGSQAADWEGAAIPVDQNFLDIQRYASPMSSRVINGEDGKIYFVQNGQKRWISSYSTYSSQYANQGVTKVSQRLIDALVTGPNIP